MATDARRRGRQVAFDLGMFTMAFPFIIPYYVFATRRWRGFLVIGGFVLLWLIATIVGFAAGGDL